MRKLIGIAILAVIFIVTLPITKLFVFNPIAYQVLSYIYPTPEHEVLLSEYDVQSMEFSPNTHFALFDYYPEDYSEYKYSGGLSATGLLDLKTGESDVLTPFHDQLHSASYFSPDGNYLLFVAAPEFKSSTNEHGTWIETNDYDLYLYELETNTKRKLNSNGFSLRLPRDAYDPLYYFGWVDERRVFYYCRTSENPFAHAYCFQNIDGTDFERKTYTSHSSEPGSTEQEILSNVYTKRTKAAKLTHPIEERSNFDGSKYLYSKCHLRGYDTCLFSAVWVRDGSEDILLAKRGDFMLGGVYWSFDDHVYAIVGDRYRDGKRKGVFKLY